MIVWIYEVEHDGSINKWQHLIKRDVNNLYKISTVKYIGTQCRGQGPH